MFSTLNKWLDNLSVEQIKTNNMRTMAQVDNVTISARFHNPQDQKFSDLIAEKRIHRDGHIIKEVMCLMPKCHRVYFEFKFDGKEDRRIGFSDIVNFGEDQEQAVSDHVNTVLLEKAKNKGRYYTKMFDENQF